LLILTSTLTRAEYITQLEAQLAGKANEANALKRENQLLKADNDSLRLLAERLISHPQFMPFMEELSRDPALAESIARVASSPPASSAQQAPKEIQFGSSQQFSQNSDVIVGMSLIPEVPVDLSNLNINSSWQLPQGIDAYQNPRVYAVTDVTPAAEPLDVAALSGKESTESIISRYIDVEEEKPTFPEIAVAQSTEVTEEESSEEVFDENNPNEALYATRKTVKATKEQDQEPIFGTLSTEKAFARYEMVVEADEESLAAEMTVRFARLEASLRSLETLTSRYLS
jgi:hypothetical protein